MLSLFRDSKITTCQCWPVPDLAPELDHYWEAGGLSVVTSEVLSGWQRAVSLSAGPMIREPRPASPARPHLSQCHCGYSEQHWGQVQGPGTETLPEPVSDCECDKELCAEERSRGEYEAAMSPVVWSQVTSWPPGSHQTCHQPQQ